MVVSWKVPFTNPIDKKQKRVGQRPVNQQLVLWDGTFSWRGPFHFLGNQYPMNFHFSFFCESQILNSSQPQSSCEWMTKEVLIRIFSSSFFLTGFSNFMIVCIDGKLRGSKSPSNFKAALTTRTVIIYLLVKRKRKEKKNLETKIIDLKIDLN